jgi:segregation and condensation protein A
MVDPSAGESPHVAPGAGGLDVEVSDQFKGPLDLLLYLIKRDEIDIHDIPVAHITREYLQALEHMEELDVDTGAEFANMASMLVEIKTKTLLPPEEVEADEETVEIDPRADLVASLLEYKRFKEAAAMLEELRELQQSRFPRGGMREPHETPRSQEPPLEADLDQLYFAFLKLMDQVRSSDATTIVATELNTEDCINHIEERLRESDRLPFHALLGSATSRLEMVSYFVAILEMIRLRRIRAFQAEDFAEIYIEPRTEPSRVLHLPHHSRASTTGTRTHGRRILHLPGAEASVPAQIPATPAGFLPVESPQAKRVPSFRTRAKPFLPVDSGSGTAQTVRSYPADSCGLFGRLPRPAPAGQA